MTEDLLMEHSLNWFTLRFKEDELNALYAVRKPISFVLVVALQLCFLIFGCCKTLVDWLARNDTVSMARLFALVAVGVLQLLLEIGFYKLRLAQRFRGYTFIIGNAVGCMFSIAYDTSGLLDTHVPFL